MFPVDNKLVGSTEAEPWCTLVECPKKDIRCLVHQIKVHHETETVVVKPSNES